MKDFLRYMAKEETIRLWEAGLMLWVCLKSKNSTADLVTTKSGPPVQIRENSILMACMAMEVPATTICMAQKEMISS